MGVGKTGVGGKKMPPRLDLLDRDGVHYFPFRLSRSQLVLA